METLVVGPRLSSNAANVAYRRIDALLRAYGIQHAAVRGVHTHRILREALGTPGGAETPLEATAARIVLDEVHDEFVEATLKAAEAVKLGDPFDDGTNMGPLNNRMTAEKMDRHMEDAADRGAEILVGGGRAPGFPTELYYEFTVIDRVPEGSLVAKEESFGPVVPIFTAADDAAAIELANRSNLGLQAAVFTNDLSKAWWYADRIRSGTVVVNDSTDFWETFQPFGGAAGTDTGWGRQLIEEFTDLQTVSFNLREM